MSRLSTAVRARSPIWWAVLAVAACGVVATAHGLYEVVAACGVLAFMAALYVPITDGLALVAYAATDRLDGLARAYAWAVVLLAAGLSGTAQAVMLGGLGEPPVWLRYVVGAWPALAVAIAAHLLWLVGRLDEPAAHLEPKGTSPEPGPTAPYNPVIPERPANAEAAVYRLYGSGDLLYVGCSTNPARRFKEHRWTQPWWCEVSDSHITWYQSLEDAADAEADAIRLDRPLYNNGLARYGWTYRGDRSEPDEPEADPDEGGPVTADELALRREAAASESATTPAPEPESDTSPTGRRYVCDAGCGKDVSKATRTRHRNDGCPAVATTA